MDEAYDFSRAVIGPRYRYIRNYRPELPAGQHVAYSWRMASMREWEKLDRMGALAAAQGAFFRPRAPEELFDVSADPDCVHNLAGDPAHRAILEEMRAANRARLLATRDLGFLPEPMLRSFAGTESPVIVGGDESRYPLAQVIALVDRLQLGERPPPDAWDEAFASPLAVLRYWAATGAVRSPARVSQLKLLLADSDASVRLAAAGALLRQAPSSEAWAVVAAALTAGRPPEERLMAMNLVNQIGGWPDSVRERLDTEPAPASPQFANYYRNQLNRALGR